MNNISDEKHKGFSQHFSLKDDFPPVSKERWVRLVEETLKGGDFEKRLVSKTFDGIRIEPLYNRRDDVAPLAKEKEGRWIIAQRMDHPDISVANKQALIDLQNGANGLVLVFNGARSARGFGTFSQSTDLERVFADIELDAIHLRFESGPLCMLAADNFTKLIKDRGYSKESMSVDCGLDPIGVLSDTGFLNKDWIDVVGKVLDRLGSYTSVTGKLRLFMADGRYAHEAGASEAQELAIVLATGVSYMKAMMKHGASADVARSSISFMLVASAKEFMTIAKFRALRHLWARVEQAFGLEPRPLRLHAETSWRMMTRVDPWVNMLRNTMASFSAAIGGADSICVLPFNNALGLPDEFARRAARNTQLVLAEESNLWRVSDPSAGTGSIETLTDNFAENAWLHFQKIEQEGGIVDSFKNGSPQELISDVRAKRDKAIQFRKEPILGASEFPNLFEEPVSVALPFPDKTSVVSPSAPLLSVIPLPSIRLSEPFERLRDRAEAYRVEKKEFPRIFLANLGDIATFTARATFAKNFFEAGGIEALNNDGFMTGKEAAEAFRTSGARIACLCSSDDYYAKEGIQAVKALKEAGCTHIYFAGKGGDLENSLKEAGIDTFIFVGCDALMILDQALKAAKI